MKVIGKIVGLGGSVAVAVVVSSSLFLSCSMKKHSIPGVAFTSDLYLAPLDRKDYEILGNVEGKGCVMNILALFTIKEVGEAEVRVRKVGFRGGFGFGYTVLDSGFQFSHFLGFGIENAAKELAVYKALQKLPEADAIISPRYYIEGFSVWPFYVKKCATVKGKAIKIKTDQSE